MKPRKEKPEEAFFGAHVETIAFIALRDGVPCQLVNISGSHKGGVLQPGVPIISFATKRDAERAVERTQRAREAMRTSFVSAWLQEKVPCFLAGEKFEVLPIGKQV